MSARIAVLAPQEVARTPQFALPRRAHRRSQLSPLAAAGLGIAAAIGLFALLAPLLLPDPTVQDYGVILTGTSAAHPLGTDQLGRDLLSRLASGARISLTVALLSQTLAVGIGMAVGGIAAPRGGIVGALLMRLTDGVLAFPALLLLIVLRSAMGGGAIPLAVGIAVFTWPIYARLVQGQLLTLLDTEYVTAASALGAGPWRLACRHLLPAAAAPLLVAWAFAIPQAVFLEASLGFLGLSVPPPDPSLGSMIHQGYDVIYVRPLAVIAPVIAVALLSLAAILVAEGIRPARRAMPAAF